MKTDRLVNETVDARSGVDIARRLTSTLALVAARVLVLAVVLIGAGEPSRAQSAQSAPPPGYRDVQFGPTTYRVPYEKYRIGIQPYDPESDYAAMVFDLILPDLAPSTSDPAEVATWGRGTGWHRQLHILVEYGRNFISEKQQFESAFSQSAEMRVSSESYDKEHRIDNTKNRTFLDFNKFITEPNGCRRYIGESINSTMIEECGEGVSMFITKCKTDVPSPSCHVMTNYADKTQLWYGYGESYLGLAPTIQAKIAALLDSFRRGPSN